MTDFTPYADGASFQVDVNLLRASPTNPASRIDTTDPELAELADNIKAIGVLQPLVVREIEDPGEGTIEAPAPELEIIAGHRRWAAAILAGLAEVPVIVRHLTDEQAALVQLVENAQRKDLTPLDEAQAFARLRDEHGWNAERIAAETGKSRTAVFNRLKLATLGPEGCEAVRTGLLQAEAATLLARVPAEQQAKALKALQKAHEANYRGKGAAMSVRHVQEVLGNGWQHRLDQAPFDPNDMGLVPAANDGAGACTGCADRSDVPNPQYKTEAELARYAFDRETAKMPTLPVCHNGPCYQGKVVAHWRQHFTPGLVGAGQPVPSEWRVDAKAIGHNGELSAQWVSLDSVRKALKARHAEQKKKSGSVGAAANFSLDEGTRKAEAMTVAIVDPPPHWRPAAKPKLFLALPAKAAAKAGLLPVAAKPKAQGSKGSAAEKAPNVATATDAELVELAEQHNNYTHRRLAAAELERRHKPALTAWLAQRQAARKQLAKAVALQPIPAGAFAFIVSRMFDESLDMWAFEQRMEPLLSSAPVDEAKLAKEALLALVPDDEDTRRISISEAVLGTSDDVRALPQALALYGIPAQGLDKLILVSKGTDGGVSVTATIDQAEEQPA